MLEYGFDGYKMSVGEHLGNPEKEIVSTLTLVEASHGSFSMPNCLILSGGHQRRWGIPEDEFVHLDGRKKMITKMQIRLLSLQALDLPCRHIMWDVGFCTGSVSIEARLQFPHLHVVSFEIRPKGKQLMHENVRRHHAPGIEVHIGDFCKTDCTDIIRRSGVPDAVFIGGHGGQLIAMFDRLVKVMHSGGLIVMNAVTTESVALFREACGRHHLLQHPSTYIQLNDNNPIHILKCELP